MHACAHGLQSMRQEARRLTRNSPPALLTIAVAAKLLFRVCVRVNLLLFVVQLRMHAAVVRPAVFYAGVPSALLAAVHPAIASPRISLMNVDRPDKVLTAPFHTARWLLALLVLRHVLRRHVSELQRLIPVSGRAHW